MAKGEQLGMFGDKVVVEKRGPDITVQVGRPVEITLEDARKLRLAAQEMDRQSFHRSEHWLLAYMTAHKAAHAAIQTIMRRSHAN